MSEKFIKLLSYLITMESKTIKVSGEVYQWLARFAAELQRERGSSVSFDDALRTLKRGSSGRDALLAVAGSWKMTDKEAERFEEENRTLWKTWKLPSA